MQVIEKLRTNIEAQSWDAVEEQWLQAVEDASIDIGGLVALLELLVASDERRRATPLYELLADQLAESSRWEDHLTLLHHHHDIFGEHLGHDEILESLTGLYDDSELFRTLAEKVGLHRATDDVPKTWTKVDKLHGLMGLAPGTVVEMRGQGAGQVSEINIQLGSFKVDLGGSRPVSVGFAAAPKMLTPLPQDHVLYRKIAAPDELRELVTENPDRLIQLTLESYDEPMTANDIRTTLSGVVPDKKWTSFWNKVRKNSRLMALPGGRQRYQWAESADDAVSTIEDRFREADLEEQLSLLKANADRDPDLRQLMVDALGERAAALATRSPADAYRIAAALDRAGADITSVEWNPDALLRAADDGAQLISQLTDRALRADALRRLPEAREDWIDIYGGALRRESEARTLDLLDEALSEAGAQEILERAQGDLLNQPRQSPGGFAWLAERAAEDETIQARSPLRLFQRIIDALGDDDFQAQRKRLLALLDSGGTVPRLIHRLDADQAARAEEIVTRATGLEDYQKTPIINSIHLKFPELRQADVVPLYTLQSSLDAKRAELKELLEVEIPANRKAIEEARELGDLRENFEYKSARQRHEYLSSLATSLNRDLSRARVISFEGIETDSVRLGTRLELGTGDETLTYSILGPWESDPKAGVLSNESELAKRLLGLEVGSEIEIEGSTFEVRSIEVHD